MPEIIFNEPKMSADSRRLSSMSSRMSKWLVENSGGYIKNAKDAEIILIAVSSAALVISLYFIFTGGTPDLPRGIKVVPKNGLPIN